MFAQATNFQSNNNNIYNKMVVSLKGPKKLCKGIVQGLEGSYEVVYSFQWKLH